MEQLYAALITAIIAIVGALSGFVVTWFNARKTKLKIKNLEDALKDSEGDYYIICPHCGNKIYLKKAKLELEEEAKE